MTGEIKQNKKVYQIIFQKIKESILNGDLVLGEKLPSERELANLYNVSRTSIREALRVLELSGIVEIRHGEGTFIKSSNLYNTVNHLSNVILREEDELLYEMLETRIILESECAYLAALRAIGQDIQKIGRCVERMQNTIEDEELGIETDLDFHLSIAQATHNSVLIGLLEALSSHMQYTIRATRKHRLSKPELYEKTVNEHKEIYLAISRGDAERAKILMREHITQIRQEMSELLLIRE